MSFDGFVVPTLCRVQALSDNCEAVVRNWVSPGQHQTDELMLRLQPEPASVLSATPATQQTTPAYPIPHNTAPYPLLAVYSNGGENGRE